MSWNQQSHTQGLDGILLREKTAAFRKMIAKFPPISLSKILTRIFHKSQSQQVHLTVAPLKAPWKIGLKMWVLKRHLVKAQEEQWKNANMEIIKWNWQKNSNSSMVSEWNVTATDFWEKALLCFEQFLLALPADLVYLFQCFLFGAQRLLAIILSCWVFISDQ